MSAAADDLVAVVRLLVNNPSAVEVAESVENDQIELLVSVEEPDRGRVIGRRGRTIDALRSLARLRGEREGRNYEVELLDD